MSRGHGCINIRTKHFGELYGHMPDSASATMNQHAVTRFHSCFIY